MILKAGVIHLYKKVNARASGNKGLGPAAGKWPKKTKKKQKMEIGDAD